MPHNEFPVALIAAVAINRVIGLNNELPWHLPADMKHFKATTMGYPVIMGRKTYESIGRPLPGRTNIILTKDKSWGHEISYGINVVHTVKEALRAARDAYAMGRCLHADKKIFVIGGEQIYKLFLDQAKYLHLTEVEAIPKGDAFFPELKPWQWRTVAAVRHVAVEGSPSYRIVTNVRNNHRPILPKSAEHFNRKPVDPINYRPQG